MSDSCESRRRLDRVVLVQALLRFGGGLDVPLQQGHVQGRSHLFGEHGFAGAGLAFDQQGRCRVMAALTDSIRSWVAT
jgi:hypothetical protein